MAFPLSDTSTNKGSLATPPGMALQFPAERRDPLLGGAVAMFVKPPRDPMLQIWNLQIQRALPSDMMVSIGYVGSLSTHMLITGRSYDYVHPSDLIKYKQSINAEVPITDYYSGKAATALASIWGSNSLPRSLLLETYPDFSWVYEEQIYDGTWCLSCDGSQGREALVPRPEFYRGLYDLEGYSDSSACPGLLHGVRPGA